MKKIVPFLLLLCVTNFVFSQKNSSNKPGVYPVGSQFYVYDNQIFYALPKNKIKISIQVRKTQIIEGPYAPYALKYLNISEGIANSDATYYDIQDVAIARYSIADSSKFYAINTNDENAPLISLKSDGVILSYNLNNKEENNEIHEQMLLKENTVTENFSFTDLGVKPFFVKEKETSFRTITTDTGFVKVPFDKIIEKSTSEEKNAEEAAAFIRKIRKRRSKLLFGMSDKVVPSDGDALQIRITELNKLEQAYIELFTGKKIVSEQIYSFDFEPSEEEYSEQTILCWFSHQKGINYAKSTLKQNSYEPIFFKIITQNRLPEARLNTMETSSKNMEILYGLYYRIPAQVLCTLDFQGKILTKKMMQIAQKGQILALPKFYITENKFAVAYYPETGAIKFIKEK